MLARRGSVLGIAARSSVMATAMAGRITRPQILGIVPLTLPSTPQWVAMTALSGSFTQAQALIAAMTATRKALNVRGRRRFTMALLQDRGLGFRRWTSTRPSLPPA